MVTTTSDDTTRMRVESSANPNIAFSDRQWERTRISLDPNPPSPGHPVIDMILSKGTHRLVGCIGTGDDDSGCKSMFLYPSGRLLANDPRARCPHCGGRLSPVDGNSVPAGIDLPDHAIPFRVYGKQASAMLCEWLARQRYAPSDMRRARWEATPVYVPVSWSSWTCWGRLAGVTEEPSKGRSGKPSTWSGTCVRGTGSVPTMRADRMTGIPDDKMSRLVPSPADGNILPVGGGPGSLPVAGVALELPRLTQKESIRASGRNAERRFLDELRSMAGIRDVSVGSYRARREQDDMLSVPVWVFRERDGDRTLLMSGQTGKVTADLPVDPVARRKGLAYAGAVALVASASVALMAWIGATCGLPSPRPLSDWEGMPEWISPANWPRGDLLSNPTSAALVTLAVMLLLSAVLIWATDRIRTVGHGTTNEKPAIRHPSRQTTGLKVLEMTNSGHGFRDRETAMRAATTDLKADGGWQRRGYGKWL